MVQALVALDIGFEREAAEASARAERLSTEVDPFGTRAQLVGVAALSAARVGDTRRARRLLGSPDAVPTGQIRNDLWLERGQLWLDGRRDPGRSASRVLALGRRALELDHVAWAMSLLHDAVRFGDVTVVPTLSATAALTSGARLLEAMATHGEALAADDPEALSGAADHFAAMGATVLAADAEAQAAAAHARRRPRGPAQMRAATRARSWAAACEVAATPALRDCPSGLTPRETAVAARAAGGQSSADIATELFVSIRTVDNHLHAAYRKLGLHGRDELTLVFPPTSE